MVQGDWNAKTGEEACKDWKGTSGHHCNTKSNDRGRRLLEFASYNDLVVANTFGLHKTPRKITWHNPDGKTHNQIDYIMVKKQFKTSVNIAKTRSFQGADIGSDHELVMMTFKLHLKRAEKQCNTRIRFDLEKLKDAEVADIFQPKIGEKLAALSILDTDMDMDMLTYTFNTAVTDTVNEILGKYRPVKKPWITTDILDLCAKRRKLKNKEDNKDRDGMAQYRAVNQEIKKGMNKAKENWIGEQCQNIDDCPKKNNSKEANKLVQNLTGTKQERTTTIQDKGGACLTENEDILKRWTEYCSELNNYRAIGDPEVLNVPPATNNVNHPNPPRRSRSSSEIAEKGKVSRSGYYSSRTTSARGRSHGQRRTYYLQQDLVDRGMA